MFKWNTKKVIEAPDLVLQVTHSGLLHSSLSSLATVLIGNIVAHENSKLSDYETKSGSERFCKALLKLPDGLPEIVLITIYEILV